MGCYCYWRHVYFTNAFPGRFSDKEIHFILLKDIFVFYTLRDHLKQFTSQNIQIIWCISGFNCCIKKNFFLTKRTTFVDLIINNEIVYVFWSNAFFCFLGMAFQFSTAHWQQTTGNGQFKSMAEPRWYKRYLFARTIIGNEKFK